MVGLGELGHSQGTSVPDRDEVVISASCKLSSISSPLEATDLRGVRNEFGDLVLGDTDIMVEDEARSCTG